MGLTTIPSGCDHAETVQGPLAVTDLFDKMIGRVLEHEGGFTNFHGDPGNWTSGRVGMGDLKGTKYGIAANTYPNVDIANLTLDQAKSIYRRDFWQAAHAHELPSAVAFSALDGCINSGPKQSIKWLQRAAGANPDGSWGPATAAAVKAADPNDLLVRYNAHRLNFMANLPSWTAFGKGWAKRIAANLLYGADDN